MKRIDGSLAELLPLMREVLESGGEFELFPSGTSMLPLLRQGIDSVILKTNNNIKKGNIYLYRRSNGDFVLHRLVEIAPDGTLCFRGDNQTVTERGVEPAQIIAVVDRVLRDGKPTKPLTLWYRLTRISAPARVLRFRKRKK